MPNDASARSDLFIHRETTKAGHAKLLRSQRNLVLSAEAMSSVINGEIETSRDEKFILTVNDRMR